jgi:hypothetical protein
MGASWRPVPPTNLTSDRKNRREKLAPPRRHANIRQVGVDPKHKLEERVMGKGNNSQGKEKKKPKKDAKSPPVKASPPPKK